MKGVTRYVENHWVVEYNKIPTSNKLVYIDRALIHRPEEHDLREGKVVEFDIVTEYSHPEHYQDLPLWEGEQYAKLKYPIPEYDPYTGEKNIYYEN